MDSIFVGAILIVILEIVIAMNSSDPNPDTPTLRQATRRSFSYKCPGAGIPCLTLPKECSTDCIAAVDFDSGGTGPVHFRLKGLIKMYVFVGLSNSDNSEQGDIFGVACSDLGPSTIPILPVWIDSSNTASGIPMDHPVDKLITARDRSESQGLLTCSLDIDMANVSYNGKNFSRNAEKLYIVLNTDKIEINDLEPYVKGLDPDKTIVSEFYFQRGRVVNIIDPVVDLTTSKTNKGHGSRHPIWGSFVFIVILFVFVQNKMLAKISS